MTTTTKVQIIVVHRFIWTILICILIYIEHKQCATCVDVDTVYVQY